MKQVLCTFAQTSRIGCVSTEAVILPVHRMWLALEITANLHNLGSPESSWTQVTIVNPHKIENPQPDTLTTQKAQCMGPKLQQ